MPEDNNDMLDNETLEQMPQEPPKKTDSQHTEETLRAANEVLRDKGIPYASAIAAGLDTADKLTGGRSTKKLAKRITLGNKFAPGGRKIQKAINDLNKSGANEKARQVNSMMGGKGGMANGAINGANNAANKGANKASPSSNLGTKDFNAKGEGTLKMPIPKLMIIGGILALAAPIIFIFVFLLVISDEEIADGNAASAGAEYQYGGTACTTITVTDTGCDASGNNCTNAYNGDIELENYVAGVVAAKADGSNNLEYYKLLAITARTYVLENVGTSCTVKGNNSFQEYIDVETSQDSTLIKQAVEETKLLVAVKEEKILDLKYNNGKVIEESDSNYTIEYYTKEIGVSKSQEIPKSWAQNSSHKTYLANWKLEQSASKEGISIIGAHYLIDTQGYNYENVIKYYYGENIIIEENQMQLAGKSGFINPTRIVNCTSPFGERTHPTKQTKEFHSGLDIGIAGGEPVYAAAKGTITKVVNNVSAINNCNYGYGNHIVIQHENGETTLYAHLQYQSIPNTLKVGDTVKQGEQIGQVGSTGCSTGNHLHYEVSLNGQNVNPTSYMNMSAATGTCER